jgi:murein tripeptide amidase MpaA
MAKAIPAPLQPASAPLLHVSCAFDGGAIEVVSLANPADIQLRIRADNASDFAQWFYFSLTGAAGLPITLRFLNAGQSAYPKGWEGYRINLSYDRQHWFRMDSAFDGQVLSCSLTPETGLVYFAYFEPYSHEQHLDLMASASTSPHVTVAHLGKTVQARDMTLLQVTNATSPVALAARKKIWLIARQHPGETMAEWFVQGFLERLLDEEDALARALLQACVFYVVPHMNPDGAVLGNLRTNAVGANLNREWANPSLATSPEVFCVRQKMIDVGVDLCLDAHGDEALPYNFCIGSDGTASFSARRKALQTQFQSVWQSTCPDFQTTHGYGQTRSTAPHSANPSLATNWIGERFDCLALTLEMPFKDNADWPDLHVGWNGERSKKLGASVLVPLLAVLDSLKK